MKKIIYILALAFIFSSCASDSPDLPIPSSDGVLLKKIVLTEDAEVFTTNFNYEGNKLISITDDTGEPLEIYTYENELLIRIDYPWDNAYATLEYDSNNLLVGIIEFSEDLNQSINDLKLIYNIDNTITLEYSINGKLTITFDTFGNIIKETEDDDQYEYTYTYDTKNSMFKNIYAIEVLNFIAVTTEYGSDFRGIGFSNNLTSEVETEQGQVNYSYSWGYTYNDQNYPTSSINYEDDLQISTSQYFYE